MSKKKKTVTAKEKVKVTEEITELKSDEEKANVSENIPEAEDNTDATCVETLTDSENEEKTEEKTEEENDSEEEVDATEEIVLTDEETESKAKIKETGQFGLGHKTTRKASIVYVIEDIGEAFVKFKNWCVKNYRTSIPLGIITVFAIVVIICIIRNAVISSREEKAKEQELNNIVTEEAVITEIPLEENAFDFVNSFVKEYYDACADGNVDLYMAMRNETDETEQIRMKKKADYIESYPTITVYTKEGPEDNSYIAYVYYEVKFKNFDTLAPGLSSFYIRTNENGELYVDATEPDEDTDRYIQEVSTKEDVTDLFNKVQVGYNDAVDSDDELKAFLEELAVNLKNDVGEELAELSQAEADAQTPDETSDGGDGELMPWDEGYQEPATAVDPGTPAANDDGEKAMNVCTTSKVNVRQSPSSDATKLGSVNKGTTLTLVEKMDNGWSKVIYDGNEGYIRSDLLYEIEAATGYVRSTQNVNIRATADANGAKLGVAYRGTTMELIESQADGWCRVIYDGQTAYVKTEFVEMVNP